MLVFVWHQSSRGHLSGSVYFVGCGGTALAPRPGEQLGRPDCSSILVPGAVIVAVPGFAARYGLDQAGHLIVVSAASGRTYVRSDSRGRYRLDLAPGIYMIAARETGWESVDANGIRTLYPPAASQFGGINVVSGATMNLDIPIVFHAA